MVTLQELTHVSEDLRRLGAERRLIFDKYEAVLAPRMRISSR
jgi:hypothetical protein